jgi:hypothetical protein
VSCYYFYLWDEDFGPAFIKLVTAAVLGAVASTPAWRS